MSFPEDRRTAWAVAQAHYEEAERLLDGCSRTSDGGWVTKTGVHRAVELAEAQVHVALCSATLKMMERI